MEPRKQAIMTALDKFVGQRPGLEFGNYGDVKAYRSEMRSITRDRHDYNTLARAVERSDSITADDIIRASEGAFSGRLSIETSPRAVSPDYHGPAEWRVSVNYVTGQYFPTEYRKAATAILASALWEHAREYVLPAVSYDEEMNEVYTICDGGYPLKHVPAGDWLRAYFRREFGRSIANRWFS